MTREESLSIITEAIEDYVCNYVTDTAKAQKMLNAIQTLEQEPSGDLISRQAVLDMWRQMICYDRTCHYRDEGRCTETFCDFKLFEYQINHMLSVNPQPCEDAISRQAVIDITWEEPSYTDALNVLTEVRDKVKALPPVKPQEPKTEQFAKWVASEIFDEMWEYNQDAFAEIACRKLSKLGIVVEMGDKWMLVEPLESEDKE